MRMPWQRRSAARRATIEAPAPETTSRSAVESAWRSLTPLKGSLGGRPPLTARSTELADTLSRRLRSTAERPTLVHRGGLPDAAAAGMVRGIATAVVAAEQGRPRTPDRADTADASARERPASEPVPSPDSPARVTARRAPDGSLTTVDAALVASVTRARRHRPTLSTPDEPDPGVEEPAAPEPEPGAPPPGLQRTVMIRRRMGDQRPLGLQAPLSDALPRPSRKAATFLDADADADAGPAQRSEVAPRSVAATVARLHGADVSDVTIERGADADRLAAASKARAVTRDGEVFIPAEAGRLDTGRGSGLLAHELTHVIQQRRLGTSVPLEHSPAGRRLEAEATTTERHVQGDLGVPAPAPAAAEAPAKVPEPVTTQAQDDEAAAAVGRAIQEELIASGRAVRMPDGSMVFPGPGGHLPTQQSSPSQAAAVMQRAPNDTLGPADAAPTPAPYGLQASSGAPSVGAPASPAESNAPPMDAWPNQPVTSRFPASPVTWPAQEAAPMPAALPLPQPGEAPVPAAVPLREPVDARPEPEAVAPTIDLDDLARRVYGQVRTQLRSELLIDRERAGLLTDFR